MNIADLRTFIDHGYVREKLEVEGANVDQIELFLAQLASAADKVRLQHEGRKSQGAPPNNALLETIRRLRIIFRSHYRGPRPAGKHKLLTQRDTISQHESIFVQYLLTDAGILTKAQADRRLPELLRDIRCAVKQ